MQVRTFCAACGYLLQPLDAGDINVMHHIRKADYERFVSLATDYPWHQVGSASLLMLAQAMLQNGTCELKQHIDL
jgi:hypothetical protein